MFCCGFTDQLYCHQFTLGVGTVESDQKQFNRHCRAVSSDGHFFITMYAMLSNGGEVDFLRAVAISTIDTSSLLNPTVGVKVMASMQAGQSYGMLHTMEKNEVASFTKNLAQYIPWDFLLELAFKTSEDLCDIDDELF